jgi:site-specific recombinase XerD
MAQPPRLLEQVRHRIRAKHYSYRTEKTYVHWIRRFILFHGKRHPREMGAAEVERFLTSLAVERKVSASTQNQALSAVLVLYRDVLEMELPWLDGVQWLVASLLYGSGLRIQECLQLRVKDVSLDRGELLVRDGKGQKDRVTVLPSALVPHLRVHLDRVRRLYEADRAAGRPGGS